MRIVTIVGLLLALGCSRDGARHPQPTETSAENGAELIRIARDDTGHAQSVRQRALAASAKPIVAAIYQFHHERGLWPDNLNELVSDYLTQDQRRGWALQAWFYNGRWVLMNFNADEDQAVELLHRASGEAEWKLDFGDTDMPLDVRPELPQFPPVNPDDRKKRRRETILGRISKDPDPWVHQQGLVSDLFKENLFQEARDACLHCLELMPTNWWPNLMLALLDLKLGEMDRGEERLLAWVNKFNDLGHVALAAYFYHHAERKEMCLAALRRAVDLPLKEVDPEKGPYLRKVDVVSLATEMSYREDRIELCLAFCNRWQQYAEKHYGTSDEYYLYRAACLLRIGKPIEAKGEFEKYTWEDHRAGKNTTDLKKAIENGNRVFDYVPLDVKTIKHADFLGVLRDYK